ncbi:MAG: heavy-metal-associated domain-containing protein, partial [Candidatus Poseidonia sp.]|nr:heavy-metal-associated domain-containing protein [Poseidonia sp.]
MDNRLSLSITGMTCSACVASVERVLSAVDHVGEVSVNLPLEKAVITLDVPLDDRHRQGCIEAILGAGYGATDLVPALR